MDSVQKPQKGKTTEKTEAPKFIIRGYKVSPIAAMISVVNQLLWLCVLPKE